MYSGKNLKAAADIITRIARENHISEVQVRADMEEAISYGLNNPDPAVQAKWANFHYSGEKPTVEEFILWVASMSLS